MSLSSERQEKTDSGIRQLKQLLGAFMASGLVFLAAGCAGDRPERTAGQSIDDQATARRVGGNDRGLFAGSAYCRSGGENFRRTASLQALQANRPRQAIGEKGRIQI